MKYLWYHSSRQREVDALIRIGEIVPEQVRVSEYIPTENDKGESLLGWWVDEEQLSRQWPIKKINYAKE